MMRQAWAIAAFFFMLGCASGPDKPPPKPLPSVTPTLKGQLLWKRTVGQAQAPLSMALHGDALTVASAGGQVVAMRLDSGRELWRAQVDQSLSAGVGSDGRFAAVVSRDHELLVLDQGKLAWRQRLASGVVTAPLVAGERVFVMGIDRTVTAFDASDGRKLWVYQKTSDALILSQPGVLAPFKDTLLVGWGAKLLGLDPQLGSVRWEPTLATPRGTNEIERLADLVGPAARAGRIVCARAFQAAVACVDAEQGALLWSRPAIGAHGVAMNEQVVLGLDASSRASAWRVSDGSVAWTSEAFLYRDLTAPVYASGVQAFVAGDLEGWVHWLAPTTGAVLLRLPTDGSPISMPPVAAHQTTVVMTNAGGLFAFKVE